MAQDTLIVAENINAAATISGATVNATTGSVTTLTAPTGTITTLTSTTANLTAASIANITGGITGGAAGASVTISGTINAATRVSKVLTGSAVTSVIVGSGTTDGQELTILHVGAAASSIAFVAAGSAAGSSHVATDFVISGQTCSKFVWEITTALWYPVVF
jgi:hypothetical protein